MRTVQLASFIAETEARKRSLPLGSGDEALRNRGGERSGAKRELLNRTEARALAAGLEPIPSYR